VAARGWDLVCLFGVKSVDVPYLWEVEYEGLVVSVFRGMGGDASVYFRLVCVYDWLSWAFIIYIAFVFFFSQFLGLGLTCLSYYHTNYFIALFMGF